MLRDDVQFFFDLGLQRRRWDEYDYSILKRVPVDQARGNEKRRQNNCFIMLDTETSKSGPDEYRVNEFGKKDYKVNHNYIVAWSLAISVYGYDIALITGSRPSECTECLNRIADNLRGSITPVYVHSLTYDYTFLRLFLFRDLGFPVKQLNTKPHYPIIIEFSNGIQLRDSLILSQCKLEKWAADLHVEHQKAVGSWDYDRIRNQYDELTDEEMLYAGNDVLAGVECLDAMRATLGKTYRGMPFTATGIVRGEARTIGSRFNAHRNAARQYGTIDQYFRMERIFHGGYTHANRHICGWVLTEEDDGRVQAFDFASSYPYSILAFKYPMERFTDLPWDPTVEDILQYSDELAMIFEVEMTHVKLKDPDWPFPPLQLSKMDHIWDATIDNGRVLEAGYVRFQTNEIDFSLISKYYDWDEISLGNCQFATKGYLPRWLTDYVYDRFISKTKLKGGDPVLYNIEKAKVNSIYGMMVQKLIRNTIEEDFRTGMYIEKRPEDPEAEYEKAVKKRGTFLVYDWGLYVTSYAQRNLFELIECTHDPVYDALYCDTDSCYGLHWEQKKLDEYNQKCRDLLLERGYGPVEHKGREYWLGVAELDGEYREFVALHSKCYACRDTAGKLKITVAGVPKKKGVECLQDNIENFKPGFIFDGETTGKLTHIYQYVPEIFIDERGNEIGDSINLVPCDYELDESIESRIDDFMYAEVFIQTYDDTE